MARRFVIPAICALALVISSSRPHAVAPQAGEASANPFFTRSTLSFQAPPFDTIKDSDYQPAIEEGMKRQRAEMDAIANDPAPPAFGNTIEAMERTGALLTRVSKVF